ncbi:phage/plasmid primase, P4 family [Thermodesulfobacteriota bacterium]
MNNNLNQEFEIKKENIPQALIELPQWVAWKGKDNGNGKVTKIPINPKTGGSAKVNAPDTWSSFTEALACYQGNGLQGVGFVFTGNDPYVGIDLDDCINPETGEIDVEAQKHINRFNSYTEITPSGRGFHILLKGSLPGPGKKNGKVEIYDTGRYFTMTGNHFKDTSRRIVDRDNETKKFYQEQFGVKQKYSSSKSNELSQKDEKLIEKIQNSKEGEKFNQLWDGNHYDFPSHSEGDLALCKMLAFWTGCDAERINRIFTQSELYRSKWDEQHQTDGKTYGDMTIQKAINSTTDTYKDGQDSESNSAPQDFRMTDFGNAERFVSSYGEDVHYCHSWEKWLIWDDIRWGIDRTEAVKRMAKATIRRIYGEAQNAGDESKRQTIAKHAVQSESDTRIKAMLSLSKSEDSIPLLPEELDQDLWLFNCENGTINLNSGELIPHQRRHLISKLSPVNYDSEAEYPLWDAFLSRIMESHEELILFLQRAIGYSLTGDTSEQCLFIFYGSGANGKSTFLQAVSAMMGDYATQTPTETLLVKQKGAIPNDVARLKGARLVTASEAEADQRLAESLIKQMTGGDKVSARFLRQEWFDFEPTHKIFLATNHKPIIQGTDSAIWRRIRLVPFEVTIPEKERDKKLLEKLKQELPGILAWAVKGCLEWQRRGLGEPNEVKTATQNYREEMDVLAPFLSDRCKEDPTAKITTKDLYDAYLAWCEENGEKPMAKRTMGTKLTEKGFKSVKIGTHRVRGRAGIKLVLV